MSYDIHIESLPSGESVGYKFFTFGSYPRHLGVDGIQKMVDRFAKCFFTPKGSDISDSEYGTQLADLFLGNIDPTQLRELAVMAVRDAEEKIREYDMQKFSPADERLANAEIEEIVIDNEAPGVEIRVVLTNTAGTRALVRFPLET